MEDGEELARYGASVDLLVLGAHKQRPVDRLWGGSTAQRPADSVPCPIPVLGPARRGRSTADGA